MARSPRLYRLLHLSDTHVGVDGRDEDGVDAVAAVQSVLRAAEHVDRIDAVVVTGDIADDGSEAGYRQVLDLIGGFAASRGIPHLYTTGNHDDRAAFAAVLGSGHRGADGADRATARAGDGERAAISTLGGLRIVTLDSLIPRTTPGVVSDAQLEWLRGILAEPAPDGTVLALHHPPIWMPGSPLRDVVLQRAERLEAAIDGSDVRIVLCGHLHSQISGTFGGVPVWVTPGVVTRIDTTAPPRLVRGVLGASATVVDLGGPHSPVCTLLQARDPRAGELVYLVDGSTGSDVPEAEESDPRWAGTS